jgi:hypothetical protein
LDWEHGAVGCAGIFSEVKPLPKFACRSISETGCLSKFLDFISTAAFSINFELISAIFDLQQLPRKFPN